ARPGGVPGREAPEAVVRPDRLPGLGDDPPACCFEPGALEEGAVVAAAEETRFLALAPRCGREAGRERLRPRRSLRLASEREPESLEQGLVERSEHVALVLAGVERTGERRRSVVVDDARVGAGGGPGSSDPVGEGDARAE